MENKISFSGRVTIRNASTGRVLASGDNIITNDGKISAARMVAGPLSGIVVPSIQEMHIGNGGVDITNGIALAPSPTQNSLENTVLEDSSIDTISINTSPAVKEVKFTSTFDSSDANVDFGTFKVNVASEVGLITSDRLLFAYKTFDRLTFDPSVPSVLQVTWTIFIP